MKINIYSDYFIKSIFLVSVNPFELNMYKYIPHGIKVGTSKGHSLKVNDVV